MTIEAPYDDSHPVSGTREFGIEQMPNGSYNIYVRGVDRFTSAIQEVAVYIMTFGDPFAFADNLWESFQENTEEFINQNGGTSTIIAADPYRPDWNKVNDVLQGERSINDLGCN